MEENGMKKVFLFLALAAILTTLFSGCSANRIENPYVRPPAGIATQPLNRTQFEVLEKTQGAATTSFIALWPIPIWWTYSDDGTFKMWGFSLTKTSTNIAINRAITIVPRADDLFDPIIEHKKFYIPWYASVTTTVKGKTIVVKTEEECKASGGNCWSSVQPITVHDINK
jgi:hypothetical protein